jgi:hypothetical protein
LYVDEVVTSGTGDDIVTMLADKVVGPVVPSDRVRGNVAAIDIIDYVAIPVYGVASEFVTDLGQRPRVRTRLTINVPGVELEEVKVTWLPVLVLLSGICLSIMVSCPQPSSKR